MTGQNKDVLFSIEGEPVMVDEFKYIYEKNNREQADYSEESVKEYLDLYINFKLKVRKARDLGYDQNTSYQNELAGYRAQLADSYVINNEVIERIIDDVYSRQQQDVEIAHLLISLDRNVTEDKEKEARDQIRDIRSQIEDGLTFEMAIGRFSHDRGSAGSAGNLGYITAPLPDGYVALENVAYTLKVGEISDPIRTDRGYHLIKVLDKRPARGQIEAEHLLIRNIKNGIRLADALPRAKKIFTDITNGTVSFNEATIKYSEDRETKGNGGHLGVFGIGQYEKSFEDAAFSLAKNGDITEPVQTSIGYHIIRRLSKRELPGREVLEERIKNQPKQGERFELMRKKVVESIKKEAKFKEDNSLLTSFKESLDDNFFSYSWQVASYSDDQFIRFDEDKYNLTDFAEFVKKSAKERMRAKGQKSIDSIVDDLYDMFIEEKAIQYAENRLEERYPEFNNLMREYKEGILLFDITKDIVWDKAAEDTTAIKMYYQSHRDNYQWNERVKVTNYSLRTIQPNIVTPILNASRKATPEELKDQFNKEQDLVVFTRETVDRNHESIQGFTVSEGSISSPTFHNNLNVTTFKKIEEILPPRPKTLREARGYVISDYQDQLDKEWVSELKKEYKVKTNKKVLKRLFKS